MIPPLSTMLYSLEWNNSSFVFGRKICLPELGMIGKLSWRETEDGLLVYLLITDYYPAIEVRIALVQIQDSLENTIKEIRHDIKSGVFLTEQPIHILYKGGSSCGICSRYRNFRREPEYEGADSPVSEVTQRAEAAISPYTN